MLEGETTTICSIEESEYSVSSSESSLESKGSNCSFTDASHELQVVGNDSDSKETSSSSIDGTHLSPDTMTTSTRDSSFVSSANSTSTSTDTSDATSNTGIDLLNDSNFKKFANSTRTDDIHMSGDTSNINGCSTDNSENSSSIVDDSIAGKRMAYASNTKSYSDDSQQNSFDKSFMETSSFDITLITPIDPLLAFHEIEQIFDEMNKKIEDIVEITKLPFSTSRILLNHFKWDNENLTQKYYDSDAEDFFRKCRVVNPASILNTSPESNTDECGICLQTSKTIDGVLTGALCGHKFCNVCWEQYLSTKIMDDGLGDTISCAEYKCNIIVEHTFVMSMLTDQATKLMYKRLLANNFIQLGRRWFWCPSPKCNLAIEMLSSDAVAICQCGVRFCHICFDDWHAPVNCTLLKLWKSDESATQVYLAARTKDCPKCKAPIEKNGGCNHMTCSRCPHQFCWICLADWSSHNSYYECNRYKETEKVKTAKTKSEKLRHFWNRYSEHRKSLRYEQELSDEITKASEDKSTGKSAKEIECFQKGFTELLECRRVLMNTYVFIYYLKDDKENSENGRNKLIFEDNQAYLQAATERLSGELLNHSKRDADEELVDKICSNIKQICEYCKNRRDVLLKHVDEGNEKMFWHYVQ